MKHFSLIMIVLIATGMIVSAQELLIPYTAPDSGELCWNPTLFEDDGSNMEDFVAALNRDGGLYTIVNADVHPEVEVVGAGTYRVPENTDIPIEIELYSAEPEPRPYRYLVLVNERQIDAFTVNGEAQPYLDIVLEPEVIQTVNIMLPEMREGLYEVAILGIDRYPPPVDGQFPRSTGYRFTFMAGATIDLQRPVTFSTFSARSEAYGNLRLELQSDPSAWDSFVDPVTVQPGDSLQFDVLAAYAGVNTGADLNITLETSYASLVALVNGRQVAISAEEKAVYVGIPLNRVAIVPFAVTAPETPGRHELMVVRVDNPTVAKCALRGPNGEYWFPDDVTFVTVPFNIEEE